MLMPWRTQGVLHPLVRFPRNQEFRCVSCPKDRDSAQSRLTLGHGNLSAHHPYPSLRELGASCSQGPQVPQAGAHRLA